jgi:tetratricopeptide (TPR) repeat protein
MAIEEYTKAIQLAPDHSYVYWDRGLIYEELGQDENAIRDYTVAIKNGSHNMFFLVARAELYFELGEYQAAIDDYTELIQGGGKGYYNNRAAAYRALGQISQADADQSKACSFNSKYC